MTWAELVSLIIFGFSSAWTPGPNNTLVANSGAHFGFRPTIPHILGIGFGFSFMVFVLSFGLGALFQKSQFLREGIRFLGIVILLWMAWKTATAGRIKDQEKTRKPFTFIGAASFQWINPKAWVMAVSISSQYSDPMAPIVSALILAAVFLFMGLSSASGWAAFGLSIRHLLNTDQRMTIFNVTMAALLVFSVVLIATANLN